LISTNTKILSKKYEKGGNKILVPPLGVWPPISFWFLVQNVKNEEEGIKETMGWWTVYMSVL
jgi:hypothetical protein